MTTTAIYTAQDALYDLVKGLDSIGGWKVDLGFPASANVQRRHVWVAGDITDARQEFGLSDLSEKDETFELRVHVVATTKGNDYVTARDRVKVLTDELKEAVNADFTLGGVVMLAQVSTVAVDEAQPSDADRQVMETVTVTCNAWLT